MLYNRLGKSDIQVSEVGFGCMSLQTAHNSENKYLIHKSIASGINYFDTADLYNFGQNEKLLGCALKGRRDKVILATKVGNKWNKDKSGWTWDVSKVYINGAIDDSLSRLQTDYVDLCQIHGGTIDDNFEEVVETLENLVVLGKIRAYGISSIRPNVFLRFAKESNLVSNMMQFSLLDSRPVPYVPVLQDATVSILARGVFAQGLLLGKQACTYLDHGVDEVHKVVNQVIELSKKFDSLPESIALAYLLNYHRVTSAVVGIRTEDHLDNVLKGVDQIKNLNIDFDSLDLPKIQYQSHLA